MLKRALLGGVEALRRAARVSSPIMVVLQGRVGKIGFRSQEYTISNVSAFVVGRRCRSGYGGVFADPNNEVNMMPLLLAGRLGRVEKS